VSPSLCLLLCRWRLFHVSKQCSLCQETKPIEDFYKHHGRCKKCYLSLLKEKRIPGARYAQWLKPYGLTPESFDELLKSQGGVCAICGSSDHGGAARTTRFCVDHCHQTGKTRGLLCHKCNRGIGLLNDDISNLQNAILYLQKHA
jgi:hypothetical protein